MTRGRILDMFIAVFFLLCLCFSFVLDFSTNGNLCLAGRPLGEACLFHALTGVGCPFCGVTRSIVALAHQDPVASFTYHPMGLVIATFMLATVVAVLISMWRKSTPVIETRAFVAVCQAMTFAIVLVWGLRIAKLCGGFLKYTG